MASQPIQPLNKGVVLTVQTDRYTTSQKSNSDTFRFSSPMEKSIEKADRLSPTEILTLEALGDTRLLVIRSRGKLTVAGLVDGVSVTLKAEPILMLSGVSLGALTITNVDAVGTIDKDVIVEAYV